nr:hypothetical protein [uncultured Pedobacter sp.]
MRKFITAMITASVLFFLGYLTGFSPVAFYVLCLFTAGVTIYNAPFYISNKKLKLENEFLLRELKLSKSRFNPEHLKTLKESYLQEVKA